MAVTAKRTGLVLLIVAHHVVVVVVVVWFGLHLLPVDFTFRRPMKSVRALVRVWNMHNSKNRNCSALFGVGSSG